MRSHEKNRQILGVPGIWWVAVWLTGAACASTQLSSVGPFRLRHPPIRTVALAPFVNFSATPNAGDVLDETLTTVLQEVAPVALIEIPSQALEAGGPVDRSRAQELGTELGADAVLYGTILEYEYVTGAPRNQGTMPSISLTARMVSTRTGSVLWAAGLVGISDQKWVYESIPLEELTQVVAARLVEDLQPHLGAGRELYPEPPAPSPDASPAQVEKSEPEVSTTPAEPDRPAESAEPAEHEEAGPEVPEGPAPAGGIPLETTGKAKPEIPPNGEGVP